LRKGDTLHTADLAFAESLNVIWKHVSLIKDLKPEEAMPATEDLTRIYNELDIVETREVAKETTQIALTLNITVYDALFVAAAQKVNGILYTADQKLYEEAIKTTNSKLLKPKL
jgi:predicted nucleic acid-binding protein